MLLEDHIVKTMTMKGSPFIGPFEQDVMEWDQKLVRVFFCLFFVIASFTRDGSSLVCR